MINSFDKDFFHAIPAKETWIGKEILELVSSHPQQQKLLSGKSIDQFVEERTDQYFIHFRDILSEGYDYIQAKEIALEATLSDLR